jgi:uncharacterized protein YkwD
MRIPLLFVLLAFAGCQSSSEKQEALDAYRAPGSEAPSHLDAFTQEYMELVNEHRMRLGIGTVKYADSIAEVALGHSQNMGNKSVPFGHLGSRLRCQRIRRPFPGSNMCGEIVAMGQRSPQQVFDAWMNSPGHREAIENPEYTHSGLGWYRNSSGTLYWTQLFLEVP